MTSLQKPLKITQGYQSSNSQENKSQQKYNAKSIQKLEIKYPLKVDITKSMRQNQMKQDNFASSSQKTNNTISSYQQFNSVNAKQNKPEEIVVNEINKNLNQVFQQESNIESLNSIVKNQNNSVQIMKFDVKTKAGINMYKKTKQNQDNFEIKQNFMQIENCNLFQVFDGHGEKGHHVSAYLRQNLHEQIKISIQKDCNADIYEAIKQAFLKTHQLLIKTIECSLSGSTSVSVLMFGNQIFTMNLGDSRAILFSKIDGNWCSKNLSNDHKPNLPQEKKRILQAGGKVERIRDPIQGYMGPYRVWNQSMLMPGLAMSRSFGDLMAAKVGVSQIPEIIKTQLNENDKFIAICSDGVTEFLNDSQIMNLIIPYYLAQQPEKACEKVVIESTNMWTRQFIQVDDITIMCIFLKSQ